MIIADLHFHYRCEGGRGEVPAAKDFCLRCHSFSWHYDLHDDTYTICTNHAEAGDPQNC